MSDALFWLIGVPATVSIFIAIYYVNFRNDYLRGYMYLAISLLLINFGWMALISSKI